MRTDQEQERGLDDALTARLAALSAAAPRLDDDVRAAQRSRLVAMAAVRSPQPTPSRARRVLARQALTTGPSRWRARLTAGLAATALSVGGLSAVVALSRGAEPGDLLYDVKRGTEQTQLALADDSERGLTLLGFASTRLTELDALLAGGPGAAGPVGGAVTGDGTGTVVLAAGADAAVVREVLQTMDRQTVEGTYWLTTGVVEAQDGSPLQTLAGWTDAQRAGLDELEPELPAGTDDVADASRALVDRVAARGAELQTALACPHGFDTVATDALGPVPGPCLAPPAADPTVAPGPDPTGTPPTTPAPGSGSSTEPAPAPGSSGPTETTAATGTSGPTATSELPSAPSSTEGGAVEPPGGTSDGTATDTGPSSAAETGDGSADGSGDGSGGGAVGPTSSEVPVDPPTSAGEGIPPLPGPSPGDPTGGSDVPLVTSGTVCLGTLCLDE